MNLRMGGRCDCAGLAGEAFDILSECARGGAVGREPGGDRAVRAGNSTAIGAARADGVGAAFERRGVARVIV